MSEMRLGIPEKKQPQTTPELRQQTFDSYETMLLLTDEDYEARMLVVGSGDGSFAYEAEHRGLVKPGMIDNVDVAAGSYQHPGPSIDKIVLSTGQADARDMSMIPDGTYKRVFSHYSVPGLFGVWLRRGKEEKDEMLEEGFSRFNAEFIKHGDAKDIPDAVYRTLREMLRVAAVDGEVRITPIVEDASSEVWGPMGIYMSNALESLHKDFEFETVKAPIPGIDTDNPNVKVYTLVLRKFVSPRSAVQ